MATQRPPLRALVDVSGVAEQFLDVNEVLLWCFFVVFGGFCIGLGVFCCRIRVRLEKLIE